MSAFFTHCAQTVGEASVCGAGCPVLPRPEEVKLTAFLKQEEQKHAAKAAQAGLNVAEHEWRWAYALTPRAATDGIVLHHAAGDGAPEAVHEAHRNNGWAGIGYHYYVRKDGTVHRGRPEWAAGAHVANENSHLIGICFEGNFEQERMGAAQLAAGRLLLADVQRRCPVPVTLHRQWSATACPGKNFPLAAMTAQKEREEEKMKVYQTIEELPFGGETVQKLVEAGALKGDGDGLNISYDMLRVLVVLDRLGRL